jgi:hypothetical protein
MDWVLVTSSVALGIATVVLAFFTYRLAQETRAARQPRMVASLDLIAPNYGELRIVNAGAGAAIEVDITFAASGGEERRWTESVVMPGDGVNFNLMSSSDEREHPDAKGDLDHFIEAFTVVEVSGSYEDVRGKKYSLDQVVDVKSQWAEAKRASRLAAFRGPLLPFYEVSERHKRPDA